MLRELFTQVELGDHTPSQLMRHMRSLLAGRHMDDAIFREIWLEKLPVPMQQVLAMLDSNTPLKKLATHADRIKECYPSGASCSTIQQPPPSKGKPHQGIDSDSEGPPLSEHDTPYTEKVSCCCTTRRAPTSAGPSRTPTAAYRTDYDDLRDTVRLFCTQVSNMCSALNSLQAARKQPYSHRRSKSRERRSQPLFKRPRQPVMATTAAGPSRPSRLFYINDKSSGLRFLVDTGAEVSVIPPLRRHRLKPSQFSLQTANSTAISTYGQRCLTLDLGLRRRFQWVFIEADVKSPIIGADFLSSFGLTVDVRHRRLTDTTTQLFTIEGRDFSVHTDHKPLTYALKAKPDRYSPREVRHLDYISQFTADIRYVRGSDNVVADALSRPDINTLTSDFDLARLADLQTADESIADLQSTTWSVNLPLVLLGIRSSVKEDIQCTAAELVYGTPLRLPGEFVQPSTTNTNITSTFVQQLKQRMAQLRPTPTRLTSKHAFVHEDLKSTPFVFNRHDAVRKPLCSPYDGPYQDVQRNDKFYVLQKADKTDTVSIDRLKPAYLECLPSTSAPSIPPTMSSPDTPTPLTYPPSPHLTILPTQPDPPPTPPPISSRSGRHIRFPARLKDFVV
nr:unnamed protein product [Spirometra erinaceieuropaei]